MTMNTVTDQAGKEAARRARLERVLAIHNAAVVREHLGQAAHHRRLPDGRHEVSRFDRQAGEMRTWTGATLSAALSQATGREVVIR
jgi:hypothetical protein